MVDVGSPVDGDLGADADLQEDAGLQAAVGLRGDAGLRADAEMVDSTVGRFAAEVGSMVGVEVASTAEVVEVASMVEVAEVASTVEVVADMAAVDTGKCVRGLTREESSRKRRPTAKSCRPFRFFWRRA
jgi:hypothetical protein